MSTTEERLEALEIAFVKLAKAVGYATTNDASVNLASVAASIIPEGHNANVSVGLRQALEELAKRVRD